MITRILNIPLKQKKSFFLLGPRATGKTQWLKNQLPDALYLDLLDSTVYMPLLANPGQLADLIPKDYQGWIFIDEIQRIPQLLNEVHRLIEHAGHRFILTGSSARSLRKKGVNLLAGRALIHHMHPLVPEELGEAFILEQALQYGLLPALLSEADPHAYLKAYVMTYLKEEVMQEGLTRNLMAFSKFLEVASFSQAQILNMAAIARETGTSQKNVSNYFDILEDLLIAARVPVFSKRAKRRVTQHPKFYYFDVGVYQTLRPSGLIDSNSDRQGPALETLCFQSMRALNDYHHWDYQFYYWRTITGLEVDLVAYGPQGFFALEFKLSKTVTRSDAKGLRAFAEEYPEARLGLVYCGEQAYNWGTVQVYPAREFLLSLQTFMAG